ncbi:MAG: thioredoxin family protein [Candidatus Izemoplasmatales bacterium]|nr:thioredoxin family protein [Candidatus Izemoplasmatales bacterium]
MKKIENYEEFLEIIKHDISIVIAKTKTCSVCKPISEKLKIFMNDYPQIPGYELYIEDIEMFQGQHLVFTVPTILVFSNGKEILRESRFIDFNKIKRLFDLYLN